MSWSSSQSRQSRATLSCISPAISPDLVARREVSSCACATWECPTLPLSLNYVCTLPICEAGGMRLSRRPRDCAQTIFHDPNGASGRNYRPDRTHIPCAISRLRPRNGSYWLIQSAKAAASMGASPPWSARWRTDRHPRTHLRSRLCDWCCESSRFFTGARSRHVDESARPE